MKKLLFALITVLCLATQLLVFTSCHSGEGESEGEANEYEDGACRHIWDTEPTVDIAPTCKAEGTASVKCTECEEVKEGSETTLPVADHAYITKDYYIPGCVSDGYESVFCGACGKKEIFTIPANGIHTWSECHTVDLEPTCTKEGYQTIRCVRCTEAIKPDSGEAIPPSHTWSDSATVDTEPTATEPGLRSVKCLYCSAKMEGSEEIIPPIGQTDPEE